MSRPTIAVINGPNLNLLGTREPEIYGTATLADIESRAVEIGNASGFDVVTSQFNGEGQIIDAIHALRGRCDAIVINAGAYSHSSLAIRDALTGVSIPYVEVHISNVYAREPERHFSMLSSDAVAVICGLGVYGYEAALNFLIQRLSAASRTSAGSR